MIAYLQVQRTSISDRIRKLQEFVPNMEKVRKLEHNILNVLFLDCR
jgi:hypothetical protein